MISTSFKLILFLFFSDPCEKKTDCGDVCTVVNGTAVCNCTQPNMVLDKDGKTCVHGKHSYISFLPFSTFNLISMMVLTLYVILSLKIYTVFKIGLIDLIGRALENRMKYVKSISYILILYWPPPPPNIVADLVWTSDNDWLF